MVSDPADSDADRGKSTGQGGYHALQAVSR
jgi:hypothetical protein